MNPNRVIEVLAAHASVRRFRDAPLDGERIREAVAAAQYASTSSHVQAYCVLHVRDAARREKLSELAGGQPQVREAGAFFVVCGDVRRHLLVSSRAGHPHAQNLETFLVAVIDASLFAQNLAVAFESMGLGICFIGALRNDLPEVDALLHLPKGAFPLYGLCVGEPQERMERKPRLPLAAVLFEDRYPDDDALLARLDAYDEEMTRYYEERGYPGRSWARGILEKFELPRRQDLYDYYQRKGARLR